MSFGNMGFLGGKQRERALERREMVEDILERARLLDHRSSTMLVMYLEKGMSLGEVAIMTGLARKTISRRIRRNIWRLKVWRRIRMAE
jgi:DNA-directed RNA polymerase specialized sigma subunit